MVALLVQLVEDLLELGLGPGLLALLDRAGSPTAPSRPASSRGRPRRPASRADLLRGRPCVAGGLLRGRLRGRRLLRGAAFFAGAVFAAAFFAGRLLGRGLRRGAAFFAGAFLAGPSSSARPSSRAAFFAGAFFAGAFFAGAFFAGAALRSSWRAPSSPGAFLAAAFFAGGLVAAAGPAPGPAADHLAGGRGGLPASDLVVLRAMDGPPPGRDRAVAVSAQCGREGSRSPAAALKPPTPPGGPGQARPAPSGAGRRRSCRCGEVAQASSSPRIERSRLGAGLLVARGSRRSRPAPSSASSCWVK